MLQHYLEQKPLFYTEIDTTRMPRIYAKVKPFLRLGTIIHIIGTNGKGTTGRFLATALHSKGLSVGHYTSPHILHFNERVWLDGKDASDAQLQEAHLQLQKILSQEESQSLSYFEYTTLLAMFVYQKCDYVVLEAGLGGEHDATSVFENSLTLVTPIAIDHQSFLGESIEEIAATKLRAMQKNCILAEQNFSEVYEIAQNIAKERGCGCYRSSELLQAEDRVKGETIADRLSLSEYLRSNLRLSMSALNFLEISYTPEDFANARLFGRMSYVRENIIVDVGHNPLAAGSIAKALKGEKYILIYNSYQDKDYDEILSILKPVIARVEIIALEDKRVVAQELLEQSLENLHIEYKNFEPEHFVVQSQQERNKYLVFGSFSVVEKFLKGGYLL